MASHSATAPASIAITLAAARTPDTARRALPGAAARKPGSVPVVGSEPAPFACGAASPPAEAAVAAVGGTEVAGAFDEFTGGSEIGGVDGSALVVGTGAGVVGGG
ncbi:MAG: hypothetical protein L6R42_008819 [Xanthoria sp. 1 TBL-2021]|nr:MAG: hypothetical protein L6R42_008819 [Xanthoria sp. 1 TBL-2021]